MKALLITLFTLVLISCGGGSTTATSQTEMVSSTPQVIESDELNNIDVVSTPSSTINDESIIVKDNEEDVKQIADDFDFTTESDLIKVSAGSTMLNIGKVGVLNIENFVNVKWSLNKRYDFYTELVNIAIEGEDGENIGYTIVGNSVLFDANSDLGITFKVYYTVADFYGVELSSWIQVYYHDYWNDIGQRLVDKGEWDGSDIDHHFTDLRTDDINRYIDNDDIKDRISINDVYHMPSDSWHAQVEINYAHSDARINIDGWSADEVLITVVDIDDEGWLDVVIANPAKGEVYVYYGDNYKTYNVVLTNGEMLYWSDKEMEYIHRSDIVDNGMVVGLTNDHRGLYIDVKETAVNK